MGRSLKEALLDQFALLQERGLAPSEMPQDDESPLIVVETAPRGRSTRVRRESVDRYSEREDEIEANGQFNRDRRRPLPRREHGVDEARDRRRPPARGRGRRPDGEAEPDLLTGPAPLGGQPAGVRPPLGPRPMGGAPRPGGPPRPGMGAPRPGLGVGAPRPQAGRTEMMQQRAELRRREEDEIAEMKSLLADLQGAEMDEAAMETFSKGLLEELGALPPPRIVVEAIKATNSAEPRKIGDAVRAYYRRPKGRPQPQGEGRPVAPAEPRVPTPA